MATNKVLFSVLVSVATLCASTSVWSREAASPSACQAAAASPAIVDAKSALDGNPADLEAHFKLADAWSDAGCFADAVQVLQNAVDAHSGDKELETRLRVARSLVGEEHFFDNLDRADAEARLKRASFRCTSLYDLDACNEALHLKPDDPALLVAQGDSLVRAKRPADALNRYRLAAVIAPNQHDLAAKIASTEGQVPQQTTGAAIGGAGERLARAASPLGSTPSSLSSDSEQTPLRAANTSPPRRGVPGGPARRYSNAAPEAQSH